MKVNLQFIVLIVVHLFKHRLDRNAVLCLFYKHVSSNVQLNIAADREKDQIDVLNIVTMPPSPAPSILSSAEAFAGRNTEGVHNSLLSGWKDHHTTVQENATRILKLHRVEEERKAAEQAANAAEKLLAEETAKALAEKRRIEAENARKQIPPPPKVQPTQVQQEAVPGPSIIPEVQTPAAQKPARAATPPSSVQQIFEQTIEQKVEISAPKAEPSFGQSQSTKAQIQPIPPALQANPTQFQQSTPPVQTMTTSPQAAISLQSQQDVSTTAPTPSVHNTAPAHKLPSDLDRLAEIHKNLKHLRKMVMDQEKTFRAKAGDMRRIIVRSLGQLTPGPNKQQVSWNLLKVSQDQFTNLFAEDDH